MKKATGKRINDTVMGRSNANASAETSTREDVPSGISPSVRDRLVRLAYRFLWNMADAEDVAHDALAKTIQHESALRDTQKWWSWTSRIVVRACHEHGRKKRRQQNRDNVIRQSLGHESKNSDDVAEQEQREKLRGLIERLPRRQREVIVLRHLEGHTFEEISRILGVAESTVRVHAQAGREALRNGLRQPHEL